MKRYYIAIGVLVVVGIVTIALNYTISLPIVQDSQRVTDIARLHSEISNYFNNKSALPSSLSNLDLSTDLEGRLGDYTYTKKSFATYDLCTTFNTDAGQQLRSSIAADNDSPGIHHKGYQCFTTVLQSYNSLTPSQAQDQPANSL